MGLFWDYEDVHLEQAWAANHLTEQIQEVHHRMVKLKINRWIGQGATVADPEDVLLPQLSPTRHKAFIQVVKGQYLTAIAPPIWVWADPGRLSGAWCLVVTTYVYYWEGYQPQDEMIHTGLIPVSTLDHDMLDILH